MSQFDYSKMAAIALAMLTKFGTTATIGDGVTARTCLAVQTKVIKHVLDNSDIEVGDMEYIIDGNANPQQGERFSCAGDNYILAAKPINIKPADVILAWYVYGRIG